MNKEELTELLNSIKEQIPTINMGNLDIGTLAIAIGVLALAWIAFKVGVKIGKQSLDYNHKLEILNRVAKVFHEANNVFPPMYNSAIKDIDNSLLTRQADQLKKLAKIMQKDIAMWSMTAPTSYLEHTHKLAEQIEKTAKNMAKTQITNKMSEKKIKSIVKKHHTPILATYESMVKAMRKDIRSDGISKIIKNIIHS